MPPKDNAAAAADAGASTNKGGRKKADPNETPTQRHKRVQEPRVRSALKAIQRVGDPAALKTFEYGDSDISNIVSTLRKFVDTTEANLQAHKGGPVKGGDSGPAFTL